MARHDVGHKGVKRLSGRRIGVERDGLNPAGERVNEDEKLSIAGLALDIVVCVGHVEHVNVEKIERILSELGPAWAAMA